MDAYAYPTVTPKQSIMALFKAFTVAISICLLVFSLVWAYLRFSKKSVNTALLPTNSTPIASISYTSAKNTQLGNYIVPLVTVPIKVNQFEKDMTFLIDTGAIITTIPMEYAKETGLDLTSLKRLILSSLTSQTVFGYLTTMNVTLNDHQVELPVSFAPIDTPVLGRYGFLDTYTLVFDHQQQAVIVATNKI